MDILTDQALSQDTVPKADTGASGSGLQPAAAQNTYVDLDGTTRDASTDEPVVAQEPSQQAPEVEPVLGTIHTASAYQLLLVNQANRTGSPVELPSLPELGKDRKGGYCRRWFIVKAAVGTEVSALQLPGVGDLIVGKFTNATAALVHKTERTRVKVPAGCSQHEIVPQGQRLTDPALLDVVRLFLRTEGFGTIELRTKEEDGELPSYEEVTATLLNLTKMQEFDSLVVAARNAKHTRTSTRLQKGLLISLSEYRDYARTVCDASTMLYRISTPGFKAYPRDFAAETPKLRGVRYSAVEDKVLATTLEDAIDKEGLYMTHACVFVGMAESGKSTLIHALCRELSSRHSYDRYGFGKAIDPYWCLEPQRHHGDAGGFRVRRLGPEVAERPVVVA